MFPALLLAFSAALPYASASASSSQDSVTWLEDKRSAIVKLETAGYPLWLMDKANAPMLYKDAEPFYYELENRKSATALNVTMGYDNHALYINHQPVYPSISEVPPAIGAYQIPANYTTGQIKGLVEMGLFRGYWEGLTLGWRWLELDYDRIVTSDPESTTWTAHQPTLVFRIMGLGAHSRSDVLEPEEQMALHVTLKDEAYKSSKDPKRSLDIIKIEFKEVTDSYHTYGGIPITEVDGDNEACSLRSWKCADADKYFYQPGPKYRFIWRSRFDEFGRIGSLRHAVYQKISILSNGTLSPGRTMVVLSAILFAAAISVLTFVMVYRKVCEMRNKWLREAIEYDDRLLGDEAQAGEKFVDVESDGEDELPPPLPPRPTSERGDTVLVDV